MSVRHRPRVRRWRAETSQGETWAYQVVCSCTHTGEEHYTRRLAETDRSRHLMDVAAPPEEQCRSPREHGCQSHDRCVVCSHQLALFDL